MKSWTKELLAEALFDQWQKDLSKRKRFKFENLSNSGKVYWFRLSQFVLKNFISKGEKCTKKRKRKSV